MVQAWQEQEEYLLREQEAQAQRQQETQEMQRKIWRATGRCEECGAVLGLWERMRVQTRCKKHRC
jgi:hypothetical protein